MARHLVPGQRQARGAGFTLLELIIVIVVIGIIGVSASARMQDDNGYTEYSLQSRFLSTLRNIQGKAMQDNRAGYCYRTIVSSSGDGAYGPTVVNYVNANQSTSCGATIAANAPTFLTARGDEIGGKGVSITFSEGGDSPSYIDFDYLGRPITATGSCASNICRVSFTGTATVGVCVEAQGLIYAC
ncbi:prepilin-type N-terminal cleavage/methylation domain-containing protein [Alteromonas lipotrueae]|uniref:prepilin-type N-terminal cleavage/methylation domain-containing protein n=1 Tax=Alteromonas lipotrueae TaxID=2803814 RepID=UPI001C49636F|nr:prepilin-type N-terminal cleavage/methylation domain-containing protein [Alteromonas lipotrueae]